MSAAPLAPPSHHDGRSLAPANPVTLDLVRMVRRRRRRRQVVLLGALTLAVLVATLGRVLLGDFQTSFLDFVRILGGAQVPGATFIVLESKLPRACLAVLVGAALGLGGAIFQTLLRNPLASPDVIGINMGASVAAVFTLVVVGWSGQAVSVAAIVGALAVAVTVRLLGRTGAVEQLVVIGVVINALLIAVVQYLLTRADIYDAQAALAWLTGSLRGARWPEVAGLLVGLGVLVPLVIAGWRALQTRELGDEAAIALGTPRRTADLLLAVATVWVGAGVAAAGPVAFVSFLAGPLSRALNQGRVSAPAAAALGALLVVVGDFVGAELIGDLNLPVGVITGACGAPFLLFLLTRSGGTWR